MLLALILVVGVLGGNDGILVSVPDLREALEHQTSILPELRHQTQVALDGTPDSLLRGRSDIRVAGEDVVVETEAIREWPDMLSPRIGAPPEGGVDGSWYISIFCCRNDPGGAYCGATASGLQVAEGMVACSRYWSFGTRFRIRGDGLYPAGRTCTDRGGAVTSPFHLDVFFRDCGIQEDPAPGTGWHWLQRTGTRVMVEVLDE